MSILYFGILINLYLLCVEHQQFKIGCLLLVADQQPEILLELLDLILHIHYMLLNVSSYNPPNIHL